jgi:hypothetical protein
VLPVHSDQIKSNQIKTEDEDEEKETTAKRQNSRKILPSATSWVTDGDELCTG